MNNLQMLLMSRLDNKPMTGYELTKSINTGHSHQQVYRELKSLEGVNLVKSESIAQDGKPDKRVYTSLSFNAVDFKGIKQSDLSKTEVAYMIDSINCKVNNHVAYIEHMRKAELEFIHKLELEG